MKYFRSLRFLPLFTAAIMGAGLSGCIIMHNDDTTISGRDIAPDTFAQVVPGKTRDFVIGLLGEPTERTKEESGNELWKWRYSLKHESGTDFILIPFDSETKVEKIHSVEFKDGLVTKAWSD